MQLFFLRILCTRGGEIYFSSKPTDTIWILIVLRTASFIIFSQNPDYGSKFQFSVIFVIKQNILFISLSCENQPTQKHFEPEVGGIVIVTRWQWHVWIKLYLTHSDSSQFFSSNFFAIFVLSPERWPAYMCISTRNIRLYTLLQEWVSRSHPKI